MPSTTDIIRALPAVEECAGNLVYGFSGLAQILLGSGLAVSILSSLPYVGIFIGISYIIKWYILSSLPNLIGRGDRRSREEEFEDNWGCFAGGILLGFAAAALSPFRLAYPILPYLGFWMKSYLDLLGAIANYRRQDENSSEAIISSPDFKNLIEKALIFTGWTAVALPLMLSISATALSGAGFAFLAMGGLIGISKVGRAPRPHLRHGRDTTFPPNYRVYPRPDNDDEAPYLYRPQNR